MTESNCSDKSVGPIRMNAIITENDEKKSSDKMEEEIQSFEPNRKSEVATFHSKSTSDKINGEMFSVNCYEATKFCTNVNDVNGKLSSDCMDDEIDTSESFRDTKNNENTDINDVHSFKCYEATKFCTNVNDVNGKLSSDCMDDEIDTSERDTKNNKNADKNDVHSYNEMEDEVLSSDSDGDIVSDMDVIENKTDIELNFMKNSLLDCVAKSDGFFKSQQVGESDLTFTEKRETASNLLTKSLPLFLQRYWKFIKIEDVPYFDAERSNYEVNFYVNEIIKLNNTKVNKVRIKNRRYEALQRMVDEGSYFSDAEMKKRNPFLYDQMIGQHLTEKERIAAYKEQYPDKNFSAFLLNQMEKNIENCLFEIQKNEDEAIVEEEDDDETEEEESELEDDEPVKRVVSITEKKQLRSEFTNIMYENFLDGKDKEFDYSSVDNNADFDSIHQRDIDEQEKYFDEESSHSCD